MATLTQTAWTATKRLRQEDSSLGAHKRDLGHEANEARKKKPSSELAVEQQRAQVAEQQQQDREAAQFAQRGEDRQSPEQEASARRQNSPQQKQNKAASLVTKAWRMILHHIPKKIMGLARAMGMPVDYAEAMGAAKHGVDTKKEMTSSISYKNTARTGGINPSPDNERAAGAKKKDLGLAA